MKSEWFKNQVKALYLESLPHRLLKPLNFDDKVQLLRYSPLSVFFYNQRFIFYLSAWIFWIVILGVGWAEDFTLPFTYTLFLLFGVLSAGTVITFFKHPSFLKDLEEWANLKNIKNKELTPLPKSFNFYFLVDFFLFCLLLVLGGILNFVGENSSDFYLPSSFLFLLFSNIILYCAYNGFDHLKTQASLGLLFILILFWKLSVLSIIFPTVELLSPPKYEPEKIPIILYLLMQIGPILGSLLMSMGSVIGISKVRKEELDINETRLKLLGKFEGILSESSKSQNKKKTYFFRNQLELVLKELCDLPDPFWYNSACLWFIENQQPSLYEVAQGEKSNIGRLIPGPHVNINLDDFDSTLRTRAKSGFISLDKPVVMISLKEEEDQKNISPVINSGLDAAAAFIPLFYEKAKIGVLALYGKEGGNQIRFKEIDFLKSLGVIISKTLEQSRLRDKLYSQIRMNALYKHETLEKIYKEAVEILQDCLDAQGCMYLAPIQKGMEIMAFSGFEKSIKKINDYAKEGSLTKKVFDEGTLIRFDVVSEHNKKFDGGLLKGLEDKIKKANFEGNGPNLLTQAQKEFHCKVLSWMGIPIISKKNKKTLGVIKVVNRVYQSYWFTDDDEKIAKELAERLNVIVTTITEREDNIRELKQANMVAEENALKAESALKDSTDLAKEREENILSLNQAQIEAQDNAIKVENALMESKKLANEREEDIMTLSHQVLHALTPISGAISSTDIEELPSLAKKSFEFIGDLTEDAITVCYSTLTSFSLERNKSLSTEKEIINVKKAVGKLGKTLKNVNSRWDLKFELIIEDNFPALKMDNNVFTSVIYSLIDNAMKYSYEYAQITLECGFEWKGNKSIQKPVIKVKSRGEPIHPEEKEHIFSKFGQGKNVKKGRHHKGVGLGLWAARKLMRASQGDLIIELSGNHPTLSVFIVEVPTNT